MSANYRVIVTFDASRSAWVARVPELEHCRAEGATRAEAIRAVEEEIQAQVANIVEQGGQPPRPVDDDELTVTGELTLKISRSLHRELAYQARTEGVEINGLVAEMLPLALEMRRRDDRRRPRPPAGRGRGGERYFDIMEDRASFLEYVRGLEQGGAPGPGGGRRRRRRRGPQGGADRGEGLPGGDDDDGADS